VKVKLDPAARAAALRQAAERLRAGGYGAESLRALLQVGAPDDVGLLNRAPALERLRRDRSTAAVALRLFYLEADEGLAAATRLLGAEACRAAVAAGLLARRGTRLHARLRIDVHGERLLLADRRLRGPDPGAAGLPRGDMVYPPGGDSVLLAAVVPARDGEQVLDLCTGSGIQALAVARRAARVVAVDIGPRAAALARLNAAVDGADNVEVRRGDLYGAVRGERFDLVIANPPFVPAPERGPAYHSGGPRGDRVLRRVVAGLEAHLAPGGRAVAISHLALRRGEQVADAVAPWLVGFGGRMLVLELESGTPVDLAAAQALFALESGFDGYAREIRRWVDYLDRRRIERVALLIFCAERGGPRGLEVVDARPRTLPLPLSPPPEALIATWLERR
jgi:HemK-related putative methylase